MYRTKFAEETLVSCLQSNTGNKSILPQTLSKTKLSCQTKGKVSVASFDISLSRHHLQLRVMSNGKLASRKTSNPSLSTFYERLLYCVIF